MVTIEAFGHAATFDGITWRSSDAELAELLMLRLPHVEISPAFGRRDLVVANEAVRALKHHGQARIVHVSRAPASAPDTIF